MVRDDRYCDLAVTKERVWEGGVRIWMGVLRSFKRRGHRGRGGEGKGEWA